MEWLLVHLVAGGSRFAAPGDTLSRQGPGVQTRRVGGDGGGGGS